MTRAGRWCNGQHATPVGGDPGSNPVASAKESASDTVCGFLFAVLAQRSVLQSSKLMMRVRFPYTARYDSMPVGSSRRGSHDHATRVRWSTSPFVRRTRGPSPAPIILWVDDSHQPSVGRVGANPISLSAQCGKGFLERGRPRFLSADPHDVETVSVEHGRHSP